MEEDKSKSQKKREAKALQGFAERLAELSVSQLQGMEMCDDFRRALLKFQQIKSHVAKKRELQFLGRLLRQMEEGVLLAMQQALITIDQAKTAEVGTFHRVELWRDRLIAEDESALHAFVDEFACDAKALRSLVRQAKSEQSRSKHHGASKALFRWIRDVMA